MSLYSQFWINVHIKGRPEQFWSCYIYSTFFILQMYYLISCRSRRSRAWARPSMLSWWTAACKRVRRSLCLALRDQLWRKYEASCCLSLWRNCASRWVVDQLYLSQLLRSNLFPELFQSSLSLLVFDLLSPFSFSLFSLCITCAISP